MPQPSLSVGISGWNSPSPTSHYGHRPGCGVPESSLAFPRAHNLPLWQTVSPRSLELGEGEGDRGVEGPGQGHAPASESEKKIKGIYTPHKPQSASD